MDNSREEPRQAYLWYKTWWRIYLHPSQEFFREILCDPKIKTRLAFLWLVFSGIIAYIMAALDITGEINSETISPLCLGILLGPLINFFGLLLAAYLLYAVANRGEKVVDKNRFFYCVAAILAPASIIFGGLVGLQRMVSHISPVFGLGTIILSVIFGLYVIWLMVVLVRAGLTLQEAQGSVSLPLKAKKAVTSEEYSRRQILTGGLLLAGFILFVAAFVHFSYAWGYNAFCGVPLFLGGLALLGGTGTWLIIRARRDISAVQQLSQSGLVADGSIIYAYQITARNGRAPTSCSVTFEYLVTGKKHLMTQLVTLTEYQKLQAAGMQDGSSFESFGEFSIKARYFDGFSIKVRYLPDKPGIAQVVIPAK